MKIISNHAADKAAWEAAESERAAAAKKLADDAAKLLNASPKLGEKHYDCRKMLTGARPACKSGLCCGAAVEKNKAESIIIESC